VAAQRDVAVNRSSLPAPVHVEGASLRYVVSGGASSLREIFVRGSGGARVVQALDGVDLLVRPGEVAGIIGHNGAGKTTLMKLLAKVLRPTSGRVVVRGTISPLIALGAGFDPELTGRENVVLFGAMLGRSPQTMRLRTQAIADWAGVEDFLDAPVRTYSSGMVSRLAFAVAVDVQPDVLLVDEALAVGDEAFQRKSLERISELVAGGACAILVTHDLDQVSKHCDRAIWLDHGRLRLQGPADEVVGAYRAV
jgi:ABC-type polysaccharide/polyol phosphate transport system ATPase subunit